MPNITPTFEMLAPFGQEQATIAKQSGYLRMPIAESQLGARNDIEAIQAWLDEYQAGDYSRHTLAQIRKESERFVLWTALELAKPISGVKREDVNAYRMFLFDPQPKKMWCGPSKPRESAKWRPFTGPLKPSSVHQALTILKGLYDYLVDMRYLSANPFRQGRRRARNSSTEHAPERMIDSGMWQAIVNHLDSWPTSTIDEHYCYERARFLFMFSFLLAPRVNDYPMHTMDDMEYLRHEDGSYGWWWRATGKGSKTVKVPMSEDALNALKRWRRVNKLPDLPTGNEAWPLVGWRKNPRRSIEASMVYKIIKGAMTGAGDAIADDEPKRAKRLYAATPHWLRHAALSRMAETMPLQIVRDLGRHSDVRTTSKYVHTGTSDLHRAAQGHRIQWGSN